MVIYLNVSVKYEGVWYDPGKTLEVSNDVGKVLTDSGQANFLGFRCPCGVVITGDTIKEAQRKYKGHRSGHGKQKLKKEKQERAKRVKERK